MPGGAAHMSDPERFAVAGRVIVVTGAGRGIGAAVAAGLARAGARVHGLDIRYAATEASYDAAICDVTDEAALRAALDDVVGRHGRVEGLVNAAGISLPPAESYSRETFLQTLTVNTLAPLRLSWLAAQAMRAPAGRGGSIVNVTSLGAHLGFPDNPAYQMSKAAIGQLTRAMAVDFGGWGVRVNCLCPGYVATDMTRPSYDDPDANRARVARTILGRWAQPEDLVGPCQFLLSDASAYVTGIELPVDGGWLAKGL
jgi:NAD(P)-dependent dehydrogenase (short-subunit alcohol dehydrogenase family)